MRRRVVALLSLAALAVLALAWSGQWGRAFGIGQGARQLPRQESQAARARTPPVRQQTAVPRRDLFSYGDSSAAPVTGVEQTVSTAEPVPTVATSVGPRLVGFVRTASGTKAALAINAAVELLGPQDESQGYRVLGLDEDQARVRLRAPTGEELDLRLAPR